MFGWQCFSPDAYFCSKYDSYSYNMEIIYLHHSGFVIKTNDVVLIIDFFEDSESESCGVVHDKILHEDVPLYVLSSHFHADHFNRQILGWKDAKDDIKYIFSHDIYKRRRVKKDAAVWLKKGEVYADNHIKVTAFGSTDVGISFMIELEGKTLFHAGDLNNWHWMDESPEKEWKRDEQKFLEELHLIQEQYGQVDVAMFPIDPRLGKEYMRGGKQFIRAIRTSTFIPMHFWNDYAAANVFQEYARLHSVNAPEIRHRGQVFADL